MNRHKVAVTQFTRGIGKVEHHARRVAQTIHAAHAGMHGFHVGIQHRSVREFGDMVGVKPIIVI